MSNRRIKLDDPIARNIAVGNGSFGFAERIPRKKDIDPKFRKLHRGMPAAKRRAAARHVTKGSAANA
jgi:hypothetical protein